MFPTVSRFTVALRVLWAVTPVLAAQDSPDPWRPRTVPLVGASYAPDVGLLLGAGVLHTRYGFRALPPSTRLVAEAAWATAAGSFRVDFSGEFRRPLTPAILSIPTRWSGIELVRFYGVGNETAASRPDTVYRVRHEQLIVAPQVTLSLGPRLRLSTGPLLKYAHTPADSGTLFAATGPWYGGGAFGQVGAGVRVELDTRDTPAAPAHGVHVAVGAQGYPAIWSVGQGFDRLTAEMSAYVSSDDPASAVLALRVGGAVVGGTVPFQELVYVGGEATVRGYAEQRFAGRRGAYASAELRLLVSRFRVGDVGVFGLSDAGRVWAAGETSARWHAALGGGVWYAREHRRTQVLSIAVARSPERTAVYARAGLGF
jgi:Omp85 superfamily domain